MNNEITAVTANQNFQDTVTLKRSLNGGFLELARLLKENKDDKLYKVLGYETFEAYLATPELALSRSHVYTLIQIYEKLVVELKVQPAELVDTEWSKLQIVLPQINENNKEDLLDKARSLSRSDLKAITSGEEHGSGFNYNVCPMCNGSGRVEVIAHAS